MSRLKPPGNSRKLPGNTSWSARASLTERRRWWDIVRVAGIGQSVTLATIASLRHPRKAFGLFAHTTRKSGQTLEKKREIVPTDEIRICQGCSHQVCRDHAQETPNCDTQPSTSRTAHHLAQRARLAHGGKNCGVFIRLSRTVHVRSVPLPLRRIVTCAQACNAHTPTGEGLARLDGRQLGLCSGGALLQSTEAATSCLHVPSRPALRYLRRPLPSSDAARSS